MFVFYSQIIFFSCDRGIQSFVSEKCFYKYKYVSEQSSKNWSHGFIQCLQGVLDLIMKLLHEWVLPRQSRNQWTGLIRSSSLTNSIEFSKALLGAIVSGSDKRFQSFLLEMIPQLQKFHWQEMIPDAQMDVSFFSQNTCSQSCPLPPTNHKVFACIVLLFLFLFGFHTLSPSKFCPHDLIPT